MQNVNYAFDEVNNWKGDMLTNMVTEKLYSIVQTLK